MTDALPYAELKFLGASHWEGEVSGHPSHDPLILYVMQSTPTERLCGLWSVQHDGTATFRNLIGSGIMHRSNGVWTGTVQEHKAVWHISQQADSTRVAFREHAPCE